VRPSFFFTLFLFTLPVLLTVSHSSTIINQYCKGVRRRRRSFTRWI
jgi:hypothetical protein